MWGPCLLPKVWACVMVPASVADVMPKVDSIMWAVRTLMGPLSTGMGLMPTEDAVTCTSHQETIS